MAILLAPLARAERTEPDLYLDGQALTREMAPWIATHFPDQVPLARIPGIVAALAMGTPFSSESDPSVLALRRWMLSRPDGSIYPDQLLKEAIRIQNGQVFAGMQLAYDVLVPGQNDLKWGTKLRNFQPPILKLADITGESADFDGNFHSLSSRRRANTIRGDVFSAWYHFFGTAIYGYYNQSRRPEMAGLLRSLSFAQIRLRDSQVDRQKRHLNDRAGFEFGESLAKAVGGQTLPAVPATGPLAGRPSYLTLRPDLFGESWYLKPGQAAKDYRQKLFETQKKPTLSERVKSIRELAFRGDSSSLEALEKLVFEGDQIEPIVSLWALGERTDENSLAVLKRALKVPGLTLYALEALALRKDPDVVEIVAGYLRDEHPDLRRGALSALSEHLADPQVPALLQTGLSDSDRRVRNVAASLLGDTRAAYALRPAVISQALQMVEKERASRRLRLRLGSYFFNTAQAAAAAIVTAPITVTCGVALYNLLK